MYQIGSYYVYKIIHLGVGDYLSFGACGREQSAYVK